MLFFYWKCATMNKYLRKYSREIDIPPYIEDGSMLCWSPSRHDRSIYINIVMQVSISVWNRTKSQMVCISTYSEL
jgi:hypothetical protein